MEEEEKNDYFRKFKNDIQGVLIDTNYGVPSAYVWLPYGLKMRNNFFSTMENVAAENGYEFYGFPVLLKKEFLESQKKMMDFENGVIYVTRFGKKELAKPLYLRPDSIAQVLTMAKAWIKSNGSLPLRLSTEGEIYRVQQGYPIISGLGGIMLESYAFFATEKEAQVEIKKLEDVLRLLVEKFYLPVLVIRKLESNKLYDSKIAFYVRLPQGKVSNIIPLYNHGLKYSKSFNLAYRDGSNKYAEPYMCSWGVSERMMGIMLMLCSDEKGLVIPPEFTPIKIVIIPISKYADLPEVKRYIKELTADLSENGFSYLVDNEKGFLPKKYEKYERMGVPIRIEVGKKEVDGKEVLFVRRDTGKEARVKRSKFVGDLDGTLKEISDSIKKRIMEVTGDSEVKVKTLDELSSSDVKKIKVFGCCETEQCRRKIRETATGKFLGMDARQIKERCIVCGKNGKICYISRKF
jgi:prolyl-tRNA synthetase